jgi:hypothetical protein
VLRDKRRGEGEGLGLRPVACPDPPGGKTHSRPPSPFMRQETQASPARVRKKRSSIYLRLAELALNLAAHTASIKKMGCRRRRGQERWHVEPRFLPPG